MIFWKSESPTHATSSCGKFSVYLWGNVWVADCNGKAVTRPSKEAAKAYCESKQTR